MQRRQLLQSALTAVSSSLLWSPTGHASPVTGHDAYFSKLNDSLKRSGPGRPVMLIDKTRMNHNIDSITGSVGQDKTYRAVVKSLPSVPLLQHVIQRAGTQALMVFHQPFLNTIANTFPNSDALLGKPMPVRAAKHFYSQLTSPKFRPEHQVQWLIDTQERLQQYLQMARTLGVAVRCNFEIDVGLRRGGLSEPAALTNALKLVAKHPQHLKVSGLMGYEPHLTGMKAELNHPAVRSVLGLYDGFINALKSYDIDINNLTFNGAGSHTLRIYERDRTMNDLSAGSGVVMPTDFDTHHLRDNLPALFIATPILKRYEGNPIIPGATGDMARLYYIYGGKWKAKMTSPVATGKPIYESTNQSPVTTSRNSNLQVDDYMFLRPTQSEFVMLQFGDLLTITDGEIDQRWPVFHQTG